MYTTSYRSASTLMYLHLAMNKLKIALKLIMTNTACQEFNLLLNNENVFFNLNDM